MRDVLVGIPVYNDEKTIAGCLDSVLHQAGRLARVKAVVVVASGCTDRTVEIVRNKRRSDGRILLVEEEARLGKASALNKIFNLFDFDSYDYLVVTNGDAVLESDAVDRLVECAESCGFRLVCGSPRPFPSSPDGGIGCLHGFIWDLHNAFLTHASSFDRPHCTDELMCFSRGLRWWIPPDTVNDGAYFSVLLSLYGLKCGYCPEAVVHVSTPRGVYGLIKQRSRIILGHVLLKEKMGHTSNTFESTFLVRPALAFRILVGVVLGWGLKCFIKAVIVEMVALLVAIARSVLDRKPWVWERVDYAETGS